MNLKAFFSKTYLVRREPDFIYRVYRILPFRKVLLLEATERRAASDFISSIAAFNGSIHVTWED